MLGCRGGDIYNLYVCICVFVTYVCVCDEVCVYPAIMGPPQKNATGLRHFERHDVTHDVFFPCAGFRVEILGFRA